MTTRKSLYLVFCLILLCSACAKGTSSPTSVSSIAPPPSGATPSLATPYAQQPAAGICASIEEDLVVITLETDISDPRCVKVRADQKLSVVNQTQKDLDVQLGDYEAKLAPGDQVTIDIPFGDYLAAGVHQLKVDPCCGAEIWLEGN